MESPPGEEAQDFGQGAWVIEAGRGRRPHVLPNRFELFAQRMHRSIMAAAVENFIRGLENAFRNFGGVRGG